MGESLSQIFREFYNDILSFTPKLSLAILVMLVFAGIAHLFYNGVARRIHRVWKDNIVARFSAEATRLAIYLLGIIISLNILGFGGIAGGLIAGAGVGAIVLGFAFKDIGENFLAGILLALNRPFEIGDIIEVDSFKGRVKELDLRTTHLRNFEGKDIYLPNSMLLKNALINYTKDGYLRVNFMIGLDPNTDLNSARKHILEYLSTKDKILKQPRPEVIIQELGEFTIDVQVLFWVNILENKNAPDSFLGQMIRSVVIEDIKLLLDELGIQMPSQVIEHKMHGDNVLNVQTRDEKSN